MPVLEEVSLGNSINTVLEKAANIPVNVDPVPVNTQLSAPAVVNIA